MVLLRAGGAGFVRRGKIRDFAGTTAAILTAAAALFIGLSAVAEAKTPGTIHCYGGWCHRINSIDEMDGMVGRRGVVTASYYDDCRRDRFNPCGLTSSGAVFRPDQADNAASPIFPDGTILLTYNPETKLSAVVRVTSAGPYRDNRTLDVSRATAEQLGFLKRGVATLEVAILKSPNEQEARYQKMRVYAPVPGFIGRFPTFEHAHDAAIAKLNMDAAHVAVAVVNPLADIERLFPRALAEELRDELPEVTVALPDADVLPAAAIEASEIKTIETPVAEVVQTRAYAELPPLRLAPAVVAGIDLPILQRIAAFIEDARSQARVHRVDTQDDLSAYSDFESRLTFAERARSFIRAAQVRARLGVAVAGNVPGALASR
jgi:rare lipoprotein A